MTTDNTNGSNCRQQTGYQHNRGNQLCKNNAEAGVWCGSQVCHTSRINVAHDETISKNNDKYHRK